MMMMTITSILNYPLTKKYEILYKKTALGIFLEFLELPISSKIYIDPASTNSYSSFLGGFGFPALAHFTNFFLAKEGR